MLQSSELACTCVNNNNNKKIAISPIGMYNVLCAMGCSFIILVGENVMICDLLILMMFIYIYYTYLFVDYYYVSRRIKPIFGFDMLSIYLR